jgi:hypothetical protein
MFALPGNEEVIQLTRATGLLLYCAAQSCSLILRRIGQSNATSVLPVEFLCRMRLPPAAATLVAARLFLRALRPAAGPSPPAPTALAAAVRNAAWKHAQFSPKKYFTTAVQSAQRSHRASRFSAGCDGATQACSVSFSLTGNSAVHLRRANQKGHPVPPSRQTIRPAVRPASGSGCAAEIEL